MIPWLVPSSNESAGNCKLHWGVFCYTLPCSNMWILLKVAKNFLSEGDWIWLVDIFEGPMKLEKTPHFCKFEKWNPSPTCPSILKPGHHATIIRKTRTRLICSCRSTCDSIRQVEKNVGRKCCMMKPLRFQSLKIIGNHHHNTPSYFNLYESVKNDGKPNNKPNKHPMIRYENHILGTSYTQTHAPTIDERNPKQPPGMHKTSRK